MADTTLVHALQNIATRLRIHSVESTTKAGSGHPSSCSSAAELTALALFPDMRLDPPDPHRPRAGRAVVRVGHAGALLYAASGDAGRLDRAQPPTLRQLDP